eukprot:TRINITY_DN8797_c0_g1_i1.p1 TRINITY_DN8797_c0_g1~~TRINITY_DN8797_c0_g1_i1.p1  ORF type:complete len:368 (-),score=83.88 TRINITY_DN8797_c0_g1_i1:174-1277(-)
MVEDDICVRTPKEHLTKAEFTTWAHLLPATPGFTAPELLAQPPKASKAVDIYSACRSLLALLIGAPDITDLYGSDMFSPKFKELIRTGTSADPSARPTAAFVKEQFRSSLDTMREIMRIDKIPSFVQVVSFLAPMEGHNPIIVGIASPKYEHFGRNISRARTVLNSIRHGEQKAAFFHFAQHAKLLDEVAQHAPVVPSSDRPMISVPAPPPAPIPPPPNAEAPNQPQIPQLASVPVPVTADTPFLSKKRKLFFWSNDANTQVRPVQILDCEPYKSMKAHYTAKVAEGNVADPLEDEELALGLSGMVAARAKMTTVPSAVELKPLTSAKGRALKKLFRDYPGLKKEPVDGVPIRENAAAPPAAHPKVE